MTNQRSANFKFKNQNKRKNGFGLLTWEFEKEKKNLRNRKESHFENQRPFILKSYQLYCDSRRGGNRESGF